MEESPVEEMVKEAAVVEVLAEGAASHSPSMMSKNRAEQELSIILSYKFAPPVPTSHLYHSSPRECPK